MKWVLAMVAVLAALVAWLNLHEEDAAETTVSAELVERGAYLARAGNCMGCHTTTGGAAYAGGRGIETPFGLVVAPNITPDAQTGIGAWTTKDFWRAMHHGRSKDGRLLSPAFPYPSFTNVTREDSDALYAYLRSVPAVARPNDAHALRFPYNTQAALAVWRALYFRPADVAQAANWERGKYLVEGLGHCAACHSGRNFLGGTSLAFAGGLMPDATWYAPSLASHDKAAVVRLLKDGVNASGPMAEVVFSSTQHLSEQDLGAMADYLASLPPHHDKVEVERADAAVMARGEKIYANQCASCHGDKGQGVPKIYPALAGNAAVTLASHHNVVALIRQGGFSPTTAGNPRPFGMPPFSQVLGNDEIADVATFIRQSWGNSAPPVSPLDVLRAD